MDLKFCFPTYNVVAGFKFGYEILFSNQKLRTGRFLGFKNLNNFVPVFSLLDWIETSWLQEIKILGVKMTS
jgi:hypothetical protein